MLDNDTKRLSRLTAILTLLQTKRLTTATSLATKFNVSVRTIYRDIRALEQAGVPIRTEEGRGYSLLEGYRLPPVSFTESEAHALITAQKLIAGNRDASLVEEFSKAIEKIKAVLKDPTRESAELLSNRLAIHSSDAGDATSQSIAHLQRALTKHYLTRVQYQKADSVEMTTRTVEPFALLSTQGNWLLLAWCRLRTEWRVFRLDRIKRLQVLTETFEPHPMTLQDYFERAAKKTPNP